MEDSAMTDTPKDTRPTLFNLWYPVQFRLDELAERTELDYETVNDAICGLPVSYDTAEKILAAVSTILGMECTLTTVKVNLVEEQPNEHKSEVARLREN